MTVYLPLIGKFLEKFTVLAVKITRGKIYVTQGKQGISSQLECGHPVLFSHFYESPN